MPPLLKTSLPLLVLPLLFGCPKTTDTDDKEPKDTGSPDSGDTSETGDTQDTHETDDTSPPEDPVFDCAARGYTVRDLVAATEDPTLHALAADFTLNTTRGEWTLSERWTGCETYLFVLDNPRQNTGLDTERFWSRDLDDLVERTPENTHYFFVSTLANEKVRMEALAGVEAEIDAVISTLPEGEQAERRAQYHYVTDVSREIEGWLSETLRNPAWGVGIDRFQTIRYIGAYSDPRRYNRSAGWFDPNVSMVSNEAIYYNFESDREERLAAQDATVLTLWDGEVISDPHWAGATTRVDIELPDAATMATFDTLEMDLELACVGAGEYGDCPAWDYINWLYLCDVENPDTCNIEFGRWITTYHREGRWVHDLSPMLAYLREGGTRRFAFYSQQPYEVHLDLRFSQSKVDPFVPKEITPLFGGGTFGPDYNELFVPMEVEVPKDAERVLLATVISGHGMSASDNCAEFCDTEHHFFVNGTDNLIEFAITDSSFGCMEQVDEGTVPNQYGTWWYGRDGWCPGKEVPMMVTDVTDQIVLGALNTFDYEGYHDGAPHPGTDANIVMGSWLVVER